MEGLAHQQEEEERRRILEEMHDVDRKDMMGQFASPNFVQQVKDSGITEDDQSASMCTFKPRLVT